MANNEKDMPCVFPEAGLVKESCKLDKYTEESWFNELEFKDGQKVIHTSDVFTDYRNEVVTGKSSGKFYNPKLTCYVKYTPLNENYDIRITELFFSADLLKLSIDERMKLLDKADVPLAIVISSRRILFDFSESVFNENDTLKAFSLLIGEVQRRFDQKNQESMHTLRSGNEAPTAVVDKESI